MLIFERTISINLCCSILFIHKNDNIIALLGSLIITNISLVLCCEPAYLFIFFSICTKIFLTIKHIYKAYFHYYCSVCLLYIIFSDIGNKTFNENTQFSLSHWVFSPLLIVFMLWMWRIVLYVYMFCMFILSLYRGIT